MLTRFSLVPFALVMTLVCGMQRLVKRSDDISPLEPIVQKLSADMQKVQAQLAALNHHVVFLVQLAPASGQGNTVTAPSSGPYKFTAVVLNEGHGYDPVTGIFTTPFAGFYEFSLQIFVRNPQRAMIDIKVNNHIVSRMSIDTSDLASYSNGEDSDFTSVIVKLNAGDKVWVESGSGGHTYVGYWHTFFTGKLLYTV